MTKEEIENGTADMEIDQRELMNGERSELNAVPEGFNASYLKVYYGKLFPHADIFKWMSYGNDGKHPGCDESYFGRREFSFTLDNDIYLRFQSFNSASQLENSIKEKCPFKIDIGPVYSVDPAKRHAYAQGGNNVFTPVEKELVFDIDMTDYDDVRYCCSGADVCLKCWTLMTIAIKVIDPALRGRVCVPIDPNRCEEFDPTAVPTLSKVLEEINMGGLGTDDDEWDRTSLGKSIRFFRSSFLQPLLKSCKEEIENSYNAKLQHSKTSLTW
nr:dna primase small subunit [Quercus suber]